jgi:hypothetical protein
MPDAKKPAEANGFGRLNRSGYEVWLTDAPRRHSFAGPQPVGCSSDEPPLVATTHAVTSFPTLTIPPIASPAWFIRGPLAQPEPRSRRHSN